MMKVPVLGLVENYSFFRCPDCGGEHPIFGASTIDALGAELNLPVLAKLPLDSALANAMDEGTVEGYTPNPLAQVAAQLDAEQQASADAATEPTATTGTDDESAAAADEEPVLAPRLDSGDERRPGAASRAVAHHRGLLRHPPAAEVADHGHVAGVGRPHAKAHAPVVGNGPHTGVGRGGRAHRSTLRPAERANQSRWTVSPPAASAHALI